MIYCYTYGIISTLAQTSIFLKPLCFQNCDRNADKFRILKIDFLYTYDIDEIVTNY